MPRSTPSWYQCSKCEITNIQLWRDYNSFEVRLICESCFVAAENQRKVRHQMVPAVPDLLEEELEVKAYWGYTSIPQDAFEWWEGLKRNA